MLGALMSGAIGVFPVPVIAATVGSLTLHTNPTAVSFDLGIKAGSTDSWGDARLTNITPGTYTLKLTKPDYQDWSKQVRVDTDKTTEVYAYLEPGSGQAPTRRETIIPISGAITLNLTTATGARVYVDGEYAGTTDNWGSCRASGFLPGTYTLKIMRPNYKQWSKQVMLETRQTTSVFAYLEQGTGDSVTRQETIMPTVETGALDLTALSGADIYIGEEYSGSTDTWGSADVAGIPGGTYSLKLVKSGYKGWLKMVRFGPGETTRLWAYLEPGTGNTPTRDEIVMDNTAYGSLDIDTTIQGVQVYVGREYSGATNSWGDADVEGLPPGTYTIKLVMDGYKEWSKHVKIGASQSTKVCAYLEPGSGQATTRQETITPNAPTGTLNIRTVPGASIFVGGEYSGKTDTNGNATISGVLAGTYTVSVIKSGYKDWSQELAILAGDQLDISADTTPVMTATFSADDTRVKVGQVVQFTDQSSGKAQSWVWDFGDGSTSTLRNPTHAFKRNGAYTVSLTVYEPGESNTQTIKDFISVYTPPTADFWFEPPVPLTEETVKFRNLTGGKATNWQWDFGDGDVSAEKEPEHTYKRGGAYTVVLTARYEEEISTVKKPISVRFRILFSGASIPALCGLGVMFITALVAGLRKTGKTKA